MPKRLLIITDVMGRGGVDTYTVDLVQLGLQQGWQIDVVVDSHTASSIPNTLSSICRVHQGPIYHRQNSDLDIETFYSRLLQKQAPDLVHISCGIPWGCLLIREITLAEHVPLLFTEHYVPPDLMLDANLSQRLTKVYNQSQGIIQISQENYKNIRSILSVSPTSSVYIIPNGVDIQAIQRQSPSYYDRIQNLKNRLLQGEKLRLLSASRLTQQKGIDTLLRAIAGLKKEFQQKIVLDVWGEGPELVPLQKIAEDLNIHSLVQFNPWTENILLLFSSYDLFIFPSRYEGLPFTLLEALASGISIIASNIGVHQWMCCDGLFAKLFENENIRSLTTAIENWLKNPLGSDLEKSGLLQWLSLHFDKNKNIKRTLEICDNTIREK